MSNGHFDVGLLIRTLTRGGRTFDPVYYLVYHLVYALRRTSPARALTT